MSCGKSRLRGKGADISRRDFLRSGAAVGAVC